MRASVALWVVAACWLAAGTARASAREMPCPDPRPAFEPAKIDRSLKEPPYGSTTPAYRFFAFGPEGKTVVAMVADESGGTGTGVDTLYVDLDADRDLTDPNERFLLQKARPMKKAPGAAPHLVIVSLSDWGKGIVPERKLDVPDPTFRYTLTVGSSFMRVVTATKDGSWQAPLHIYGSTVPWSTSRADAPVFRFGGGELHLRNEGFVLAPSRGRWKSERGVGRTLRPGTKLKVDAVTPFFAGSSPSVVFAQARCWVPGGHRGLRAWLEARGQGGEPLVTDIVLRGY